MMRVLKLKFPSAIRSYSFSEAQDGKGPCDRRASHIKSFIKRHVNEGNDVTSAIEMKLAIDCKQRGGIKVKVVDEILNLEKPIKGLTKTIPLITQLHNFVFERDGVRVWQFYGIGEGKLIPWKSLQGNLEPTELIVKANWENIIPEPIDNEAATCRPESREKRRETTTFDCTNEGCSRSKLNTLHQQNNINITAQTCAESHDTDLNLGWASKHKKKRTTFTEKQTTFIKDQFNVGKISGRKSDPFTCAQEMREIKDEHGKYMFTREEYLTGQQIGAYFSRLALKDRKADTDDYLAAEEETKLSNLKKEIVEKMCTPDREL